MEKKGDRRQKPARAIRLLIAHRDQSSSNVSGWFPGSGAALAGDRDTFPGQWPSGLPLRFSLHHRCGGSAGIRPASQFSASSRRGGTWDGMI